MAKSSKDKSGRIEIQKGPISTYETASLAFQNRDPTPLDLEHNRMRLEGMTLTVHEPKR